MSFLPSLVIISPTSSPVRFATLRLAYHFWWRSDLDSLTPVQPRVISTRNSRCCPQEADTPYNALGLQAPKAARAYRRSFFPHFDYSTQSRT